MLLLFIHLNSCQYKNSADVKENTKKVTSYSLDLYPSLAVTPKHKVLTLGTFHFDRSRDGSDVVANEHIDVTTEINQKKLNRIVERLIRFNPSKIAVEWKPSKQKVMDSLFHEYKKGNYKLGKHETFQIGFKVAKALGHSRVHCIDNNPPFPDYINAIEDWEKYADSLGHLQLWRAYDVVNKELNTFMDTIQRHVNVLEYLTIINSERHSKRLKELWLTGLVNIGHDGANMGADVVARWYRRNIRLFSTAKNLVREDENLLIIYGGAHKWIFDELFESAPDFQVVQWNQIIQE